MPDNITCAESCTTINKHNHHVEDTLPPEEAKALLGRKLSEEGVLGDIYKSLELPLLLHQCRKFVEKIAVGILQQNPSATVFDLLDVISSEEVDELWARTDYNKDTQPDAIEAVKLRIEKSVGNALRFESSQFLALVDAFRDELDKLIFTRTPNRHTYTHVGDDSFHATEIDDVVECYNSNGTSFILVAGVTPGLSKEEQVAKWSNLLDMLLRGPSWSFNKQLVILCEPTQEDMARDGIAQLIKQNRKVIIAEGIVLSVWCAYTDKHRLQRTYFDYSVSGKAQIITPVIDPSQPNEWYDRIQEMFASSDKEMEAVYPALFQLSRVSETQLLRNSLTVEAIFVRLAREHAMSCGAHFASDYDGYCHLYMFNATVTRCLLLDYKDDAQHNKELLTTWIHDINCAFSPREFRAVFRGDTDDSLAVGRLLADLDRILKSVGDSSPDIRALGAMSRNELSRKGIDAHGLDAIKGKCDQISEAVENMAKAIDRCQSETASFTYTTGESWKSDGVSDMPAHRLTLGYACGADGEREQVGLRQEDRTRHMYIQGKNEKRERYLSCLAQDDVEHGRSGILITRSKNLAREITNASTHEGASKVTFVDLSSDEPTHSFNICGCNGVQQLDTHVCFLESALSKLLDLDAPERDMLSFALNAVVSSACETDIFDVIDVIEGTDRGRRICALPPRDIPNVKSVSDDTAASVATNIKEKFAVLRDTANINNMLKRNSAYEPLDVADLSTSQTYVVILLPEEQDELCCFYMKLAIAYLEQEMIARESMAQYDRRYLSVTLDDLSSYIDSNDLEGMLAEYRKYAIQLCVANKEMNDIMQWYQQNIATYVILDEPCNKDKDRLAGMLPNDSGILGNIEGDELVIRRLEHGNVEPVRRISMS